MKKNHVFMMLNSLFLPLMELSTIKNLLDYVLDLDVKDLPTAFSKNLIKSYYFFLRYIIQLTFISNGVWLLDIPHLIVKLIKKIFHYFKNKKALVKKDFIDDYAFDLGYHQSYVIVIFTIVLVFSPVVPLISVFGFIFFLFKYNVDKYNLTFVYNREFEGGGIIKKMVIPYLILSLYIFQLLNVGFFTLKFDQFYLMAGLMLMVLQTVFLLSARAYYEKRQKERKIELMNMPDGIEEDEDDHSEEVFNAMNERKSTIGGRLKKYISGNLTVGRERRITI